MTHWITDAKGKRIKVAGNYSLKERQAFLMAHPIGSYYMSEDSTDPAELYGGGWEKVEGRFLLGANASYPVGQELGSANAVVVSHRHDGELRYNNTYYIGNAALAAGSSYQAMVATSAGGNIKTPYAGEDGTGKNMPPYRATNIWYRYQ